MEITLTEIDAEVLSKLPENGEFGVFDLWAQGIIRPSHRLDRLQALGLVEFRVSGDYPNLTRHYRKVNQNAG